MIFGDERIPSRFWSRVRADSETGCWLWTGGLVACGYAQYRLPAPIKKAVMVHRFAYENLIGPIPAGLELDHLCRVRTCVNPSHLEPVTHKENTHRGTGPTAANASKTHCKEGHEFTSSNTLRYSNGRTCRKCTRKRIREFKQKVRLAKREALELLAAKGTGTDSLAWSRRAQKGWVKRKANQLSADKLSTLAGDAYGFGGL